MPTLNLTQATKLYYGNTEAQKLYKGSEKLYPIEIVDPYSANVVLWLKGESLLDSSPKNQVVTVTGNVQLSTSVFKHGSSSLFFNNSGGATDYLQVSGSDFNFAHTTGDFTIESWVRYTDDFFGTAPFGCYGAPSFVQYSSAMYLREGYTDIVPSFGQTYPLNQWVHVAITRQGTSYKVFWNGILRSSGTKATLNSNNVFTIGGLRDNGSVWGNLYMRGYIDSLRITKACRYTANFNPETDTYLAY